MGSQIRKRSDHQNKVTLSGWKALYLPLRSFITLLVTTLILYPIALIIYQIATLSHCSRRCSALSNLRSNCCSTKSIRECRRSAAVDNSVFGGQPNCNSNGENPVTEFMVKWTFSIIVVEYPEYWKIRNLTYIPQPILMVWIDCSTKPQSRWSPTVQNCWRIFFQ